MAISRAERHRRFRQTVGYYPFQGDRIYIEGDVCETLEANGIVNSAGQNAAFVWKMRGFPELPVPREFANQSFTLVGDSRPRFNYVHLPIDWEGQEGLDLLLVAPREAVKVDLGEADLERRTNEAFRRQAVAAFAWAFIRLGIDEEVHGWMLRPAPLDTIRECGLGLAEVFMDAMLESYPNQIEELESLGVPIHRDWPVIDRYVDHDPLELLMAEQVIICALGGGKEPGARVKGKKVPRALGVPDWHAVKLEETFKEVIEGTDG